MAMIVVSSKALRMVRSISISSSVEPRRAFFQLFFNIKSSYTVRYSEIPRVIHTFLLVYIMVTKGIFSLSRRPFS